MKGSAHGNGNLLALVDTVMSSEMVICNAVVDFTKTF
jgi:hypothetical protein